MNRPRCAVACLAAFVLALASMPIHAAATARVGRAIALGQGADRAPGATPPPNASASPIVKSAAAPPTPSAEDVLFEDDFDAPDGLITNEYSFWNRASSHATTSPVWQMTSGSLFSQHGSGWTGVPDGCPSSSMYSTPCTASDVFRLNTSRHDFGDVTVSMDLVNNHLTSSPRTPPVAGAAGAARPCGATRSSAKGCCSHSGRSPTST